MKTISNWTDEQLANALRAYATNSYEGDLMREAACRLTAIESVDVAVTEPKTVELDPDEVQTIDADGDVTITSERP